METLSYRITLRFAKFLNILMVTLPVALCWSCCYGPDALIPGGALTACLVAAVFVALYTAYGRIYGGFYLSMVRISEMLYSQSLALVMADGILYLILCLLNYRLLNPLPMLGALIVQILLAMLWCVCAHKWYFRSYPPKKTVVIHQDGENVEALIGAYGLRKKFDVRRTVHADLCAGGDYSCLDGMETVFLWGLSSRERNDILKYCMDCGITAYVLPGIGDIILSGAKRVNLFHLPFLRVGRYAPNPEYLFAKRVFDILVSALALVILSPVMLVTAIAIKATDGGPVFYRQKRLTKDGRVFDVMKFRSMRQDAEKDGVARLSTGDHDDRITPVGRIIRKVRIDELPQLFNILGGSMSIVGPRPERPEIAGQYEQELPEFALRLQAKAGLTGYAQVYGKYNTTPYNKLQMDLMYIAHPSFLEDLRIIFATVKILFMPESTEGIEAGMETAMKKKEQKEGTEVEV